MSGVQARDVTTGQTIVTDEYTFTVRKIQWRRGIGAAFFDSRNAIEPVAVIPFHTIVNIK